MRIELKRIGKRYQREWIYRNVDLALDSTNAYVITGGNGSGKSTLLKTIAGFLIPTEGEINYFAGEALIDQDKVHELMSLATPYISTFESFTLKEALDFHQKFRPFSQGIDTQKAIALLDLEKAKNKEIKAFSSGMKQRVKLGLAFFSESKMLLLDEPTSNLDHNAIDWYQDQVNTFRKDKLTIVASNKQKDEYFFCTEEIQLQKFKP